MCLPAAAQVGGGTTIGGLDAEYFSNADLSGSPAFTRRDVRVDFAWGTVLSPSGVNTQPGYRDFPKDNYSVRWTGKILPKFSETYTFKVVANDGARLYVRPEGGGAWTTVIDAWGAAGTNTGTYALTSGVKVELKLEYREVTGVATCRLLWSSASTPEEVIESVSPAGINIETHTLDMFANDIRAARMEWRDVTFGENRSLWPAVDNTGWPMGDAGIICLEYFMGQGTYTVQFKGKAEVRIDSWWSTVDFKVGGTSYGETLPKGVGYDAASNTTTATVDLGPSQYAFLTLHQTERTPGSPVGSGFTDLKLMKPTVYGGNTPYATDVEYRPEIQEASKPMTTLRYLSANFVRQNAWGDATTPYTQRESTDDLMWADPAWPASVHRYPGIWPQQASPWNKASLPVWEKQIEYANLVGKDVHITVPYYATADYLGKLAQTFRYGSDGYLPYTSEQANPVFHPLNPNLKVYVELGNEMWNFGFEQFFHLLTEARAILANTGNPERAMLTYDGIDVAPRGDGGYNSEVTIMWRLLGLRTVHMSNAFRGVFGDAAMMTRVRPLIFGQYDNTWSYEFLPFIEDWFNNGDGVAHVGTPRPVNYFIWGGGGASYYGASNARGTQGGVVAANASFETPVLPSASSQAAPGGSSWTYNGTAGLYRSGAAGSPTPADASQGAYITGNGSYVSQTVNFTTPGTYALEFSAQSPDGADLEVLAGTDRIAPGRYEDQWRPSANPLDLPNTYRAYSSAVFTVTSAGPVTLKFQVTSAGTAYLDKIAVISADAIFASVIPYNNAGKTHQQLLIDEANLVLPYGLKPYLYEGGWSVSSSADSGGSDTSTPLNHWAKFRDPRARAVNKSSGDQFLKAGGTIYCYGSFAQWADVANVASEPIWQSLVDLGNQLPPATINGYMVPGTLTPANHTASRRYPGGGTLNANGWLSWNISVVASGTYSVSVVSTGTGTLNTTLDGGTPVATGAAGGTVSGNIYLTAGLHTLRVRATGGSPAITSVTLGALGAPAMPVVTAADGDAQVQLSWASVSGAARYVVAYGTASRVYTTFLEAGASLNYNVTGLTNQTTYYFAVYAVGASGIWSLPSVERGMMPFAGNTVANLVAWDFQGNNGSETAVAPVLVSSRLGTCSTLTRGSGMRTQFYTDRGQNSFFSHSNYPNSTTLAHALANGKYHQFTLTIPSDGQLNASTFSAWLAFQDTAPQAGLAYSTDGGANFTLLPMAGTPNYTATLWTVSLTNQPALQNVTNRTIVFRLVIANTGEYSNQSVGPASGYDLMLSGTVGTDSRPKAAAPTFNPEGGTYIGNQMVSLSSSTAGASIRYTTNGSDPSESSGTIYSGPIQISADTTLKAVAYSASYRASQISSAVYLIRLGTAATPTISPDGGNFTSVQSVSLACATPGTSIRYTTDGSIPTSTAGTLYSGPFTVGESATVKAVAYSPSYDVSAVASAAFTINLPSAATPTISPNGGMFTSIQSVSLACATLGTSIRYTTDGSTPTTTVGVLYSAPITVGTSATIKAIAFGPGFNPSAVAAAAFTINLPTAAAPVISPNGGTVNGPQTIALSTATAGASIRYTTDGSTPSSSVGTVYAGPFVQSSSATIKAVAYSAGLLTSPVTSATFTITYSPAGSPTLVETFNYTNASTLHAKNGGTGFGAAWTHTQSGNGAGVISAALTPPTAFPFKLEGLSANIPGSTWEYYRVLSASAPDNRVNLGTNGVRYFSLLFRLESSAVGYQYLYLTKSGNNFAERLSLFGIKYMGDPTFVGVVPNGSVPEVAGANVNTVYFVVGKIVSSAGSSDSLSLKAYSGSTPLDPGEPATWTQTATFNSPLVLDRITTGSGMTIDEIRFGPDWGSVTNPNPTPAKAAAPVITPVAGSYAAPLSVNLACGTPGSTIRYTTDGTTPTGTTGTVYSTPFSLAASATVKAIATASGLAESVVSSAAFTVPLPDPFGDWLGSHGLSAGTPPGTDSDNDGLNNLLEFALGGLPASSASMPMPQAGRAGNFLTFSFFRARADVTYIVEGCSDLSSWSPVPYTPVAAGQTQTVTDTVDSSTGGSRFLRLRVSRP